MNFREIENIENLVSSRETPEVEISSFKKQILFEYFENEKRKLTVLLKKKVIFLSQAIN